MTEKKLRQYEFTVGVIITVPDDFECCNEVVDCSCAVVEVDPEEGPCDSSCGGDCAQYFWERLKAWLNDQDEGDLQTTEVNSTEIERYDPDA